MPGHPTVYRLLNAAATDTVGQFFSVAKHYAPFTIYLSGGYTGAGVLFQGSTTQDAGGIVTTLLGKVGPTSPSEWAALTAVASGQMIVLEYNPGFIRATYSSGGTGLATALLVACG